MKCLWTHRLPRDETPHIAVVPDGCADIIWSATGLATVGPDRVAAFPALAAGETIFGARFRIGAAASWLRTPLDAITGQTLPLELFWGVAARDLDARMTEARSASERLTILAAALEERLPAAPQLPSDIAVLRARLDEGRVPAADPVRTLARNTGISERTLRRRCHEHFGYGAKTLDRILRLQRFLTACRAQPQGSLAMLALDAGYADQAHLAREAKELTSLTPRQIQTQLAINAKQDENISTTV
ncbi:helix-turn-helix domain-containing protein [Sinorhizobium numidicum]|uniref:Helix-turn-helix domain-containing protein n=1 Tax=Sinorhizobium numidicum TaxID=680248 RepID=A0ABY8D835_9HYPH|nr:helix-turn-helix domain-containing protein [Sinorhizobium numidicum]WEX79191.1 helix-turn-helix domain-containing protein [Sinorhizobium numidicum]WEX85213.1 helix-turn-helix domain-containing protein [Sinorhizobium numidicum]